MVVQEYGRLYLVEWWQECLVKGKDVGAVAGRISIDGCEVIVGQ